jgi:hypothetical protein
LWARVHPKVHHRVRNFGNVYKLGELHVAVVLLKQLLEVSQAEILAVSTSEDPGGIHNIGGGLQQINLALFTKMSKTAS